LGASVPILADVPIGPNVPIGVRGLASALTAHRAWLASVSRCALSQRDVR
jgi:hypothetical protein